MSFFHLRTFFHLKKSSRVNCHPLWPTEHGVVSRSTIGRLQTDLHRQLLRNMLLKTKTTHVYAVRQNGRPLRCDKFTDGNKVRTAYSSQLF